MHREDEEDENETGSDQEFRSREEAIDSSWSWAQTMNYVGQLAGQVFVQVKELYRGLNPATLSGCIDVIVVRQPDGALTCSPFHVRFGKMGVLRSREKVVDIEINGEPVNLHMKLGENGEAFFVKETKDNQEVIPSYLATSPIPSDGGFLMGSCTENGMIKKRRKRRRKCRSEDVKREESVELSEEELFNIDINDSEQPGQNRDLPNGGSSTGNKQNTTYARSDGELTPVHSPNASRPCTPKSDSELLCQGQQDDSDMLWSWGELPQVAKPSFLSANPNVLPASASLSIPVSDNTHFRVIPETAAHHHDSNRTLHADGQSHRAKEFEKQDVTPAACVMSEVEEGGANTGPRPQNKTKRKDKKSRHLGSDGVYLDDIKDLKPEVAALYFPKSGSERLCENGVRSVTASPQSMCSSGADSGVDSYDLPTMAISLCGGLTENREITKEHFQQKAVSFQQFADNPSIIDDPNLVVKIGSKYYNWSTAAPIMLAMQAFQKPLPKATVERLMKEKMPRNRGRWWFSWRGRTNSAKPDSVSSGSACAAGDETIKNRRKDESSSSDEDHLSARQTPVPVHTDSVPAGGGVSYQKTLRLSSEQLVSLQLKDGLNDVVFSVTTQYQGTCRCEGTIYLWNWDDKIIISDIDGTITRSDKLGHILPTLGKDWTHQGIARLYHNVSQNGYKFLYCSARAIGMANMTRGYLHWVNERGTMLPQGPVLLSPSSLFSALHREVIEKRPEKFKVACLTDIRNLFLPNTEPFYAAFGNRDTDVFSYKEVGVPLNRIFTVNPKGELIQEHAKTNISSYVRLGEVVDHVFPLLKRSSSCDFPCSDTFSQFTFWREQLPLVDGQIASTINTTR
ncbi:phosphatidate phosphatase LPIN1 [Pimephales promelas]|uniref:phosphatidate phosphatase LPIN1 n=1 Tax=Pimephales promelas TaxID=90988 RepID=UPI001955B875|nr:phosphatidate phosphatase LPIN1 [Pimephales promelas]KAG1938405.1 phosphatidate phosphatase LPIN1 [Pimephales promelas]